MKDTDKNITLTPFETALREYESATINKDKDPQTYATALLSLGTIVAYSVLKKCISVSLDETLIQTRRELARALHNIDEIAYTSANATARRYRQDGTHYVHILDKELYKALGNLCKETLGDGIDLVNDAIVSILTETEKAKDRNGGTLKTNFTEDKYNIRRLNRKVWIKTAESVNGWESVDTSLIQETYKAVRRSITQSGAMQTNASGYTYLEDLSTDTESGVSETIYRRFGKYADIGGVVRDYNGKETAYTADTQTVEDMDTLVLKLNLSKQQAEILKLRLSGYGYKAIATYLGVRSDSVTKQVKRIREKAVLIGLHPTVKDK